MHRRSHKERVKGSPDADTSKPGWGGPLQKARRGKFKLRHYLILLCFASGSTTDVLSYLTLGRVFTSAMTGCAALLFIALVNGRYPAAIRAAVALASYMAGGGLAAFLQPPDLRRVGEAATLRRLLIAEAATLGLYCILSATGAHPVLGDARYALIFLSALAMGIQAIVARDINEPGITTVVLNLTLTSIMIALTRWVTERDLDHLPRRNKVQIAVVLGYAAGAAAAACGLLIKAADIDLLPFGAVLITLGLYQYRCRREDARSTIP